MQSPSQSASCCLTSCACHRFEGSALPALHLSSAYGAFQRSFSGTNFAILLDLSIFTFEPYRFLPEIFVMVA